MKNFLRNSLATLALPIFIAACGGSGAGGTGTGPLPGTPVLSTLEIDATSVSLGTGSSDSSTITVTAKDTSNRTMAGVAVVFAADSGSLTVSSSTTDSSGTASAVLKPGSDRSNRTVTVTVTSGTKSITKTIAIAGTTVTLTAPPNATAGKSVTLTAVLKDSTAAAISGQQITFTAGATEIGKATTASDGSATISYTPATGGTVALTATSLGATSLSKSVSVSADVITVTSSVQTIALVGGSATITAKWDSSAGSTAGKSVLFSTTKGIFSNGLTSITKTIGADGTASTTLTPTTTVGPVTVTAQSADLSVSGAVTVGFASLTPADFLLQANPTVLGTGAVTNATVRVLVVDGTTSKNPVTGAVVFLSITNDPTGGSLNQSVVVTDSSGVAEVVFSPGARPVSGTDQVQISAEISGLAGTKTVSFTVAASALFVSIGTGNKILTPSDTEYTRLFNVRVTNSAGNAVASAPVTVRIVPIGYVKGTFAYSCGLWNYSGCGSSTPPVASSNLYCIAEDLNNDGILDVSEDLNQNGIIDPRQVAVAYFTDSSGIRLSGAGGGVVITGTTDSTGATYVALTYARSWAFWVNYEIEVATTVGGSEGRAKYYELLSGAAADYSDPTISPPGGTNGPMGTSTDSTPVSVVRGTKTYSNVAKGCTIPN